MRPKKVIIYLGNALQAHGFTVTTMEVHRVQLAETYEIVSASSKLNKIIRMLDLIRTFLKHKNRAHCVIIATFSTWNFYYAWLIALLSRFYGIPYILYLHGGNLPNRLSNSPTLSRAIFKYSKMNVAPSNYLEHAFQQAGYRVECIPNFILINRYAFKKRYPIKPKFLWVRSFEKIYNPVMTIEVFSRIAEKYDEAVLCMVGPDKDGSLEICREFCRQLGLADRVQFTGKLDKLTWIALASEYDIFLSTTRFDNMPVSILEAMA
ncbi:MAG: glycosyltransferase family 4 protein, partial [Saprospiraceae bacterium]|nr:glycosyltransferase family 4 protein [Saprospiraceae bacterium]